MDDERVISSIGRFSLVTGEVLMKALYFSITSAVQIYQTHARNQTFSSQADWDAFLKTTGRKNIQTFLKSEVNLEAFKKELEKLRIGFAFKENADGTINFIYEFKNKAIVEQALSNVIKLLTQNKEATKRLVKNPRNMKPSEKIAYYKQKGAALSQMKSVERQVPLAPTKGGISK